MIYLVILIAALIASITGIGGGVIIRPILSTTDLSITLVSFYACVAIVTSTIYSLVRAVQKKENLNIKLVSLLSVGAFIGGAVGNTIFTYSVDKYADDLVVVVQSILLILTLCFVMYATIKEITISRVFKSRVLIILVGISIGIISVFIGIGGGILNVIILQMLFKIKKKEVVINSLAMIFISQTANIILMIYNGVASNLDYQMLGLIMASALIGGIIGKELSTKVSANFSKSLFTIVIAAVMLLNVYIIFEKIS